MKDENGVIRNGTQRLDNAFVKYNFNDTMMDCAKRQCIEIIINYVAMNAIADFVGVECFKFHIMYGSQHINSFLDSSGAKL